MGKTPCENTPLCTFPIFAIRRAIAGPGCYPNKASLPRHCGSQHEAGLIFELKMMSSSKTLLLAALMSVLLLHLCSKSEGASSFDCCLGYTEHRISPKFILGFKQQLANEACDINAVIFLHKEKIGCVCGSKDVLGEAGCAHRQPKNQKDVNTEAF